MDTNDRKKANKNQSNNKGFGSNKNKPSKSPKVDFPASKKEDPLSNFRLGKNSKPKHKSKPTH